MATMRLTRAYVYNGITYGPGDADLPDNAQLLASIMAKEGVNQAAIQEERRQLLGTLPQGHPMRALIEEADENTAPEQAVAPVAVGAPQPNPAHRSESAAPKPAANEPAAPKPPAEAAPPPPATSAPAAPKPADGTPKPTT